MKKFNHTLSSVFSKDLTVECFNNGVTRFSAKDLVYLEVEKLKPNKHQPRKIFDEQSMMELKTSIEKQGILQPILARYNSQQDYYEIIAGERRLLAAKLASLTHVPVLLAKINDEEASVFAIIENIQRKDLSLMEEAEAYDKLMKEFNLTHEDISKKVGKSRSTITNSLRILSLSENIKEGVVTNKIHFGHAKIILSIDDNDVKEDFYKFILKNKLSVRDCEKRVENFKFSNMSLNNQIPKEKKSIVDKINIKSIENEIILKVNSLLGQNIATVKVNNSKEATIKIKNTNYLIKKLNFLLNKEAHDYIKE